MSLFNADDDWQESLRRTWYPRIHGILETTGNFIGVPLYAEGNVGWNQYVGELHTDEQRIERELVEQSSERNPLAAYKSLPDDRTSEGSWVFLHEDYPTLIAEGMQLHITLFAVESGRAVYAHYEDDWRVSPIKHLRGANVSASQGVHKARTIIGKNTDLTLVNEDGRTTV